MRGLRPWFVTLVLCTLAGPAFGATNMYIKFEGPAIAGTSTADGHGGEIEILSWNHGFTQTTSPARSTAGQATHQNFQFTKYLDSSTDDLLKNCWAGKQFGKVTVSCYRADGATDNKPVKYLTVVMQNVVISNFSVAGGPGDVPVENVSLDYGSVTYTYIDAKGEQPVSDGKPPRGK
jgi:type VI secretion system secreted protein Hcp